MYHTIIAAVSTDGFIADSHGRIIPTSPQDKQLLRQYLDSYPVHLMGKNTFFAHVKHHLPNVLRIVKTSDINQPLQHGTMFTKKPVKAVLATHEKVLVLGGRRIYEDALSSGLIHEVVLVIEPIILGKGMPFADNWHAQLKHYRLISKKTVNNQGTQCCIYRKINTSLTE